MRNCVKTLAFAGLALTIIRSAAVVSGDTGNDVSPSLTISQTEWSADNHGHLYFDYTYQENAAAGNCVVQVVFYQYEPATETWEPIGYGSDYLTGDDYEAYSVAANASGSAGLTFDLSSSSFPWNTSGRTHDCAQVNFYSGTPSNVGGMFDSVCVAFDTNMPQTGTFTPVIAAPPVPPPNPVTQPPPPLYCGMSPPDGGGPVSMSD